MKEERKIKKSFFHRFWWIGVSVLIVIFTVIVINNSHKVKDGPAVSPSQGNFTPNASSTESKQKEMQWPNATAKYITASPVDLTQIQSISKYRSCAGHDRSGYNFAQVLETNRSMKHYFYPVPAYQGTLDQVKMFAPFDGTIIKIDYEKDKVGGRVNTGGGLHISPSEDPNVAVILGHIYTVKDYQVGDKVTSGELVGYAALGEKGFDFDVDLSGVDYQGEGESSKEVLDSAFDHMTPSALAEFAKYGITPENTKISKEVRDANPCNYNSQQDNRSGNNWVTLKH